MSRRWGENLGALREHMETYGPFDVIVARCVRVLSASAQPRPFDSDILNYDNTFPALVETLSTLFIDRGQRAALQTRRQSTAPAGTTRDATAGGPHDVAVSSSASPSCPPTPRPAAPSLVSSAPSGGATVTEPPDASASERTLSTETKTALTITESPANITESPASATAPSTGGHRAGHPAHRKQFVFDDVSATRDCHLAFYMSWLRRSKSRPEIAFFELLRATHSGFLVVNHGQRVYEIRRRNC